MRESGFFDEEGDATRTPTLDAQALGLFFDDVERHQYDLNRDAARRAAAIADALVFAREHPWIYAQPGDPDAARQAERCAVMEATLRLTLSESEVRSLAHTAESARACLPRLWDRAREGFAGIAQVAAAVVQSQRFGAPGPDPARAQLAEFDRELSELAMVTAPEAFRVKARLLARRLVPQQPSVEHAAAFAGRRVVVEPADDGMSWISAYLATPDALAIKRRLTATAKHLSRDLRGDRSREQLRADLFADWLKGVGTPTAVKTAVFVTVPFDRLTPRARASVRADIAPRAGVDLGREPLIVGSDPLDDASARRLLLEAGRFTRVVTDPVTGVVLDMDRRARTVTRAQREWLLLVHGECTRDGCSRLAVDTEIDHWCAFHGPGRGPTDIANLHPLCEPDHKLKDTTRMRFRRRSDGSAQVVSPTGFRSGADEGRARAPDRPRPDAPVPDEPPF